MASQIYENIYAVVRRIPVGRVATYGQVAALAGLPNAARQVGYALSALDEDSDVPWHRVINAKGEISTRWDPACESQQRDLLESEGVAFNNEHRINLSAFRWEA